MPCEFSYLFSELIFPPYPTVEILFRYQDAAQTLVPIPQPKEMSLSSGPCSALYIIYIYSEVLCFQEYIICTRLPVPDIDFIAFESPK